MITCEDKDYEEINIKQKKDQQEAIGIEWVMQNYTLKYI